MTTLTLKPKPAQRREEQSRPLRVVHVVGQLRMGGLEKLLLEFAQHADRQRFDLRFVSLEDRGTLADDLEALGWPVTTLGISPGVKIGVFYRLYRLLREWNADVVHCHNTRSLFYSGLAARLARVRRVVHTRHGQDYQAKWSGRLAFALTARTVDSVVCVSNDSAAGAARDGIPRKRIKTVWNGIDCERFQSADAAGSGPVIAVGRLSPEKDFATMLHAVAIVLKQEPQFQLWIAGDGVCRRQLEQLLSELHLQENVKLLGEIRDIPALLEQGRAFAMSSLTEGISLTLLEAMAAGLPIVATHVGGNPEVVDDGVTGVLVPAGNPDRLAQALAEMWADPGRRVTMGRAGRERVEKHFSVRMMVSAYERLYVGEKR